MKLNLRIREGFGEMCARQKCLLAEASMKYIVQALSCHALFLYWFCMRVPTLLRVFATVFVSFLRAGPSL